MPDKIMLLDGNSLINRAFYALPVLTTKDGEPTNALLGFMNIFFKLYDEEQPQMLAVAFDLPAPTFRHLKYDAYKGTRKPMPDDLRPQIPALKNILRLMGITVVEQEGFEADDILGTLAASAEREGYEAVIVSGDRDLLQIASDHIKIRIPKTKMGKTETETYYAVDVVEKIGVTPRAYIDVKALMGDTSDNIPGVPGIGEKTALKIIQEYGTLDNAIANAADIKPKRASENLEAFREQAILSRELAEINMEAPVEFSEQDFHVGELFTAEAFAEIKRLELKSVFSRFKDTEVLKEQTASNVKYTVYEKVADAKTVIDESTGSVLCAYKLLCEGGNVLGIALCNKNNEAVFIKAANDGTDFFNALKPFFEGAVKKITIDAKKDMHLLRGYGVKFNNLDFDAMIAGYVLNSSRDQYRCSDIALDFLNETYMEAPNKKSIAAKQISLDGMGAETELDEAELEACCRQADILWRAYQPMKDAIAKNNQDYLFYDMEMPMVRVLFDMETYGVKGDAKFISEFGEVLRKQIDTLTNEIYEMAGEEFNINSPKQLGVILFEKLGIKHGKKTKTGWSTSADVLEKIKHPIVKLVLEYRTYSKLLSTYVDGLLKVMDKDTGRIYTTFNQTVTATGRLSSTEPNMQNIPVRTELGRELRKAFTPEEGYVFVDADYSQIELRLLAHMSGDEMFIRAFNEGLDIHTITAAQVFGVAEDMVTHEMRSAAKAVNFGIVYGISAFSLSEDINVSRAEAQKYIDAYFARYPGVHEYLNRIVEDAREKGYAETLYGRRRPIPELTSRNFNVRSSGERIAMNMPIQGTAADIIKIAMVNIHRRLQENNLRSRLILQVHDELMVEAHQDEVEAVKALLIEEMENAAKLSVPLSVSVGCGKSWFDAKE